MPIHKMNAMNGKQCACGKTHSFSSRVISGKGVLSSLPELLAQWNCKKVFVLSDANTFRAAGARVCRILTDAGIAAVSHSFREEAVEPDEKTVGSAVMHMASDCDGIVAVGSGVINDTGKILAALSGKPYIIVATPPLPPP